MKNQNAPCFTRNVVSPGISALDRWLSWKCRWLRSSASPYASFRVSFRVETCVAVLHGTARDAWHGMIFNLSLLHIYMYCLYIFQWICHTNSMNLTPRRCRHVSKFPSGRVCKDRWTGVLRGPKVLINRFWMVPVRVSTRLYGSTLRMHDRGTAKEPMKIHGRR